MSRRLAVKTVIALLAILLATFSTARAKQIWDENAAQNALEAARATAVQSISAAGSAGVRARNLRRFSQSLARLDRIDGPNASLLWGTRQSFYVEQTASYRSIAVHVDRFLHHVTARTREQATAALDTLKAELGRAGSLDLPISDVETLYARDSTAERVATTPRGYRSIADEARQSYAALSTRIAERQAAVSGILASSGGSVAAIQQLADSEAAGVSSQMSLLALFSPHSSLPAAVQRADAAVHGEPAAFAAVKAVDLSEVLNAARTAFRKSIPGKVILVSTEAQMAYLYQDGTPIYSTVVTTGGPELPTDHGIFHIYEKISPFVFHSPWPPGSPFYYLPTPVQYWMPFDGGEGLHDASWRSNFGPGSNLAPTDLGDGNVILGTHGCVNLPNDAAQFIWNWAPLETTVVVV